MTFRSSGGGEMRLENDVDRAIVGLLLGAALGFGVWGIACLVIASFF